jgi:predicted lipid-binding transport protein (Tim44 family)
MPTGVIELIILAGIAVLLLFRLRSVLGTKTGLEEQQGLRAPRPEPVRANPAPAPVPPAEDGAVDAESETLAEGDPEVAAALSAMRRAEPGFSPAAFLQGGRQAFEMLLTAFEQGDKDTLRRFLADDVFQGFAAAIDERAAAGLRVESRFVGVREARVVAARFEPDTRAAEIAVRFTGELLTVVRDAKGAVVEGDPNEIRRETDVWTFGRRMGVSDPNWRLIATGE